MNTRTDTRPGAPGEAPTGDVLAAAHLTVGYSEVPVIADLDFELPPGRVTSIIGPNGCGKSTLLRSLARMLTPSAGEITLGGIPVGRIGGRAFARRVGLLPQNPIAPDGILVADLVALGRHPHQNWLRQWGSGDRDLVLGVLERTGIADLADRPVSELSGGQRQRAWIAMVLAQQTEILLLDEPTTYLDLARGLEVLDLVDTLHTDHGRTVLMVLHDLGLAARYSDHLVVMSEGRIVAQGRPGDIITEELLGEVFGLKCRVVPDPVSPAPLIVPAGTRHVYPDVGGTPAGGGPSDAVSQWR